MRREREKERETGRGRERGREIERDLSFVNCLQAKGRNAENMKGWNVANQSQMSLQLPMPHPRVGPSVLVTIKTLKSVLS